MLPFEILGWMIVIGIVGFIAIAFFSVANAPMSEATQARLAEQKRINAKKAADFDKKYKPVVIVICLLIFLGAAITASAH